MSKAGNPELRKEWERRIATFRESGETQSKWCQVNDVRLHQLRYWLRKIEHPAKSEVSTRWVPVNLVDVPCESDEKLLIKIGDTSIEVKPGFNPSFLADVVRTLRSSC